jgi:Bacterial Ig-like domain (group 1)/Invasin, domain 3
MPEAHISFHGNELQAKKDQVSDGCGFIPGGVRDLGINHARFAMFALHESENGPLPTRTCARTCPQLAKADAALRNSRSRILYSLREREPGSRCRWRPAGASPVPPPATVTANGTSATTLAVTVDDANGNPVAGTAVTLSASGSGNTFGSVSGTTNASGVFTTTQASTLAQTETVTATEGSVQETTPVTFVAGAPSAATSTIVATPATVTANGTSATTLAVTVDDANGNPVAGTAVTLSASGSGNTFGSVSGTTNASGSAVRPSAV